MRMRALVVVVGAQCESTDVRSKSSLEHNDARESADKEITRCVVESGGTPSREQLKDNAEGSVPRLQMVASTNKSRRCFSKAASMHMPDGHRQKHAPRYKE